MSAMRDEITYGAVHHDQLLGKLFAIDSGDVFRLTSYDPIKHEFRLTPGRGTAPSQRVDASTFYAALWSGALVECD